MSKFNLYSRFLLLESLLTSHSTIIILKDMAVTLSWRVTGTPSRCEVKELPFEMHPGDSDRAVSPPSGEPGGSSRDESHGRGSPGLPRRR
uniref:Uncharacterized protein n=1 Tax=Astyanax mexicanus TaxID=7994 RepID=A0A3B1KIR8_ASTMX